MLRRKRLADLPEHWDFGELTPGAQVRVRRSGYYHHGIYIGNGEIVHFDGSPNEQDAAAVRVRRTGMEEFLRGGLPELRIYGRAERKLLRAPGEIAAAALSAVGRGGYDYRTNNCEHFSNECAFGDGTEYVSADALQQAGLSLPEAEPLQNGGMDYYVLSAVSEENRCAEYVDDETGLRYLTPGAARFSIEQSVNVPVLMYHAVSDNMWGIDELFVSPASMEEQLRYLVDNGYEPIWFSDLAELEQYEKPVILTFDDGYDDNYTELLPLLRKYNVKATVFMIADAMGMQHKMTEEQVREMADSGLVSIQSHGLTHADMDAMDEETLIRELGESQRILTRVTGRQPSVLCYPTGRYSDLTLEVAERYYNFGLKMVGGQYNTADDPFLVSRYYVSRYTSLDSFAAMVAPAGT